jgi:hypothetical protein
MELWAAAVAKARANRPPHEDAILHGVWGTTCSSAARQIVAWSTTG